MSCNNDFPRLYPHFIYFEGFQYSGSASLPGSATLPAHWSCSPENTFTTRDGAVMQCLDTGELIYSGSLASKQIRNTSNSANYAITWTTIGRENMKFEVRGRRSDASNYVALKIDAENSTIQLIEKISGAETILSEANYVFHSDILVVYECGLWFMDEHIYARINGSEITKSTTNVPATYHGMSLYVPEVFEEDPVAFSHLVVQETTEHELPSLNNENLIVMFRERIKDRIECPNHKDWETFKRAKKLYERFKDLGYSDDTWTAFGFPIEKPRTETWFGGD